MEWLQVSCDLGLFTMEIGDIPFKREVALKGAVSMTRIACCIVFAIRKGPNMQGQRTFARVCICCG